MTPIECDFGERRANHGLHGSAAGTVGWVIDLRSDTVTQPTDPMRAAMASAVVGDDVFGDDPTVNELQRYAAELLGKEAALFVTSGTQSNLCAVLAHCGRGDEYIAGDNSHAFKYEAGGAAVLGSVQPQTVRMLDDGSLDLDHVRNVVKPNDPHFARSRLLCLENTHDGKAQPVATMHEAADVGRSLGLNMHLDGARLWNAAAALGCSPSELAEPFDTISVCLSKGLGAPVGSLLVGSSELVNEAHKWRKMLGGSLRQAGVLAAGGLHALEYHRDRLSEDHANAVLLADRLATIDGVQVHRQSTNMVFASLPLGDPEQAVSLLDERGLKLAFYGGPTRLVTHLGVSTADIELATQAIREVVGQMSQAKY